MSEPEPNPDHAVEVATLTSQLREANDRLADLRKASQAVAKNATGIDLRNDLIAVLNQTEGVSLATKIGVLSHLSDGLSAVWENAFNDAKRAALEEAEGQANSTAEPDEGGAA